jgi:hypothetical protein
MSEWWEVPYPKNSKPPNVSLPRTLEVGVPNGDDVIAFKRAISRGGRWPWGTFNPTYTKDFAMGQGGNVVDTGVRGFQRQCRIPDDGVLGPQTFEFIRTALVPKPLANAGQPLLDSYAQQLLKKAPADKEAALADYCRRCIAHEPIIHYSQHRPMTHLGAKPENGFTADCSGHATGCYYWVQWPDPNKSNYNGYGWTGTLVNNPKCNSPYRVGDLALYGTSTSNTTHVCTCYVAGDASTSVWCSHGSEEGPYAVSLWYRDDLVCVVRPSKG